jgi:hypothetical protein
MISNRNIAADANIDLSKLNLLDGQRALWEDFDEAAGTDCANLYGLDKIVAATGIVTCIVPSLGILNAQANNDKVLLLGANAWRDARNCTMSTRVVSVSSLADVNIQIGWGDAAAMVIDGPVADQDWAYLEFRAGTNGGRWRLGTRITGAAAVYVDSGVPAVTAATIYNISVHLLPGGSVVAKINDVTIRSADGAIKSAASDWRPFARISASAPGGKVLSLDTFAVHESRA